MNDSFNPQAEDLGAIEAETELADELVADIREVAGEIERSTDLLIECCDISINAGFSSRLQAEALGHLELIKKRSTAIANKLKNL